MKAPLEPALAHALPDRQCAKPFGNLAERPLRFRHVNRIAFKPGDHCGWRAIEPLCREVALGECILQPMFLAEIAERAIEPRFIRIRNAQHRGGHILMHRRANGLRSAFEILEQKAGINLLRGRFVNTHTRLRYHAERAFGADEQILQARPGGRGREVVGRKHPARRRHRRRNDPVR